MATPMAMELTMALKTAMAMAKAMRMRNALERKEWSNEEDELIINGVMQYGYRWRQIAARLPGRSDDAVRNRWNRRALHCAPKRARSAPSVRMLPFCKLGESV